MALTGANLRRLTTTELLSTSRINQLSAIRSEELLCVVRSMFHGAASLGEVELNTQIFEMAWNALLKMVMGKRYYGEDMLERDVEVAKQFREMYGEGMELLLAFNPRNFFPALGWMDLRGVERRIEKHRVKMDRFMAKLLEEQRRKMRMER
ncbi:isoflavone 3'-hydroxylase-like [Elaeis guineensis]|uniref:isoflavone 3'-hydroxylase-like n=1 Tax=Elaeis guineensis var. tenera TaxID=51953 RepID=UPI003C6D4808